MTIPMTIPMLRTSVPCFLVCTGTGTGSVAQERSFIRQLDCARVSFADPVAHKGAIILSIGIFVFVGMSTCEIPMIIPVLKSCVSSYAAQERSFGGQRNPATVSCQSFPSLYLGHPSHHSFIPFLTHPSLCILVAFQTKSRNWSVRVGFR